MQNLKSEVKVYPCAQVIHKEFVLLNEVQNLGGYCCFWQIVGEIKVSPGRQMLHKPLVV